MIVPNLLIHIGYHKTGTTWFQEELFRAPNPYFYPLGNDGRPMSLASLFIRDEHRMPLSPFVSSKERVMKELSRLMAGESFGKKIPVISHERLSGYPHSGGFDSRTIADRLKDCFPQANIWIVIREQKNMVASLYLHYLKNGGTDTLEAYLTRPYDGKRPGYSPVHIRYLDLVNYYYNLFGRENVLVQPFELFQSNPAKFLVEFGDFVGCRLPLESYRFDKQRNRHEDYSIVKRFPFLNGVCRHSSLNGYSPFFISFLGRYLKSSNMQKRRRHFRIGLSMDYSSDFRERIARLVGDYYEGSNRSLSALVDRDLSQYGYHEKVAAKTVQ